MFNRRSAPSLDFFGPSSGTSYSDVLNFFLTKLFVFCLKGESDGHPN